MKNDIREGFRSGTVVALSSAPFGVLFGALAVDKGLSVFDAVLMSATVYAGASQIVGIELFGQNVPGWIVVLSVFAVNFRHILYSAALSPFIANFSGVQKALTFFLLVDPQFAEATKRLDRGKTISFRWYLATGSIVYISWVAFTLLGALTGRLIGDPYALGFDVLPAMYFLGMVMSFHRRQNFYPVVAASALASVVASHLVGSPWHVSIGAAAGILVAAVLAPAGKRDIDVLEADA